MRRSIKTNLILRAAVAMAVAAQPLCVIAQDAGNGAPSNPPPGAGNGPIIITAPNGGPINIPPGAVVAQPGPNGPVIIGAPNNTPPANGAPATQPTTAPAVVSPAPTGPSNVEIRIPSTKPTAQKFSFNFKDAPIDAVLNHISAEAGFTVIKLTPIDGRVTVESQTQVSVDEAVSLLNTVLAVNGYTAVQEGKTLKIMARSDAMKANIPVEWGNDPDKIVPNDNLVTQVIPIKTVDAAKLKQDLTTIVSPKADFTANAASNVIVVTDTQANVRRLVQIIRDLDKRDPADSGILTRQLKYADAAALVKLIQDIFKTKEEQQNSNLPPQVQFFRAIARSRGGGGFSGGGGFPGSGGTPGQDENSTGGERQAEILASSDDRTNTIVVTGPQSTLDMIDKEILTKIDNNPASEQTFFLYPLKNAQAQNLQQVLNSLFASNSSGTGNRSSSSGSGFGSQYTTGSRSYGSQGLASGSSGSSGFGGSTGRSGGSSGFGSTSGSGAFSGNSANRASGSGRASGYGSSNGYGSSGLPSGISNAAAAELIGQVYVVADPDTNSLLVATASKFENQVREIIDQLDRPVAQVAIKVLIAEVTHENTGDLGFDFSILNQHGGTINVNGVATQKGVTGTSTFANNATQAGGLTVSLVENNIQATLTALATNNKLDVLSRPYILATDNQLAEIAVGSLVPLVTDSRTTDTGETLNTVQYKQIGIIVDVTPHINPDGLVIMDVAPEISDLSSSSIQTSPGVNSPIIELRSANSRVGVKDGNTIVIGGLMQDQKTSILQKVPFLGDIPVLGVMFQNNHVDRQKTELLIFITPHVAAQADILRPMSQDEIKGLKLTPTAVDPGVFDEHIRGLQRGGVPGGGVISPPPGNMIPTTMPTTAPTHSLPPHEPSH